MKTSPDDVSNASLLQGLRELGSETKNSFKQLSERIETVHLETMEAIHELSSQTDERFDQLEGRMDNFEVRMDKFEGRMVKMESKQNHIEVSMVTKDYLDQKLSDLRFAPVLSSVQKR